MFGKQLIRFLWVTAFPALGLMHPVQAQVPERSFAGQTLVIPEEQLDQGMAYHVWAGEDAQLTFHSRAPFQNVLLSSNRVIGYILAPFDLEESPDKPVLFGAFRVPVTSLRSGLDGLDDLLQGPNFLNAAAHPELTFRISSLENVRQLEKNPTLTLYEAQIQGKAVFQGQEQDLSFPARLTFRPYTTFVTKNPGVGDALILTAQFTLNLKDYGWQQPRFLNLRMPDEIPVDIYLMLNNISPDNSGDPRRDPETHFKQQRFVTLLRDLNDPLQAYAYGRSLAQEFWENADELHNLAQTVISTEGVQRRDYGFALRLLQRAAELGEEKDGDILVSLAQVHYERGDLQAAVEWQNKAVALLEESKSRRLGQAKASLQRYEAEQNASRPQ